MTQAILDASAVLALLRDEPGAEEVEKVIDDAIVSAVNLQEIYKELFFHGIPLAVAEEILGALNLTVRAHDAAAAVAAAKLAEPARRAGCGLGDRSCMALAIAEHAPALTADKAWAKVTVEGLEVKLIR